MKFFLESFGTCSVDVRREDLAQSWPTWCRVVCRDDVAQVGQEPMVYILIGDARSAYYVGEANNARKRLNEHVSGFSWWNRALVFHHRSGAFGNSGTRKFLQQGLFDKMRALGPAIVFASKVAGSQEPENGAAPILDQICQFCRVLSILPFCATPPDLFVGGAISAVVPDAELQPPPTVFNPTALPPPPPTLFPDGSPVPENWHATLTNVAATIAKWFDHGAGGLYLILSRKRKAGDRLRTALMAFGIPVVDGYVPTDSWRSAHLPLPNRP